MRAVLIGPPGAGKRTYATYFREKYCIPHISISDLLEGGASRSASFEVEASASSSELALSDIAVEVVKRELKGVDPSAGFLLSGYPRTLEEAKSLEQIVEIDIAIYVHAPLEVVIERLNYKYICPKCRRVYNSKYRPPKNNLKCDYDGVDLLRGTEDPELVKRKYRLYFEELKPIIEYYRRRKLLVEVDNSSSGDEGIKVLEKLLVEKGLLRREACTEK